MLWLVAWLGHGLLAQGCAVALIALAAVTIAELAAAVAPAWSLAAGLVVLAVVDVVLVWGTPQVGPASQALHHAGLPSAAGHPIPRLQDATFGGATMGWLDLVAPALLGVAVRRPRARRRRDRPRRGGVGAAAARDVDDPGDGADARRPARRQAVAVRVAVVSDIHANLHAFESVLAAIDADPVDELWCLGDIVGYGPRPDECCELVRARATTCLCGNHDLAVRGALDLLEFSGDAGVAAAWTRGVLSERSLEWLNALEPYGSAHDVALFHGSARDPVWEYVLTSEAALATLLLTRGADRARRPQPRRAARRAARDGARRRGLARRHGARARRGALGAESGLRRAAARRRPACRLSRARSRRRGRRRSGACRTTSSGHRPRCGRPGCPEALAARLEAGE